MTDYNAQVKAILDNAGIDCTTSLVARDFNKDKWLCDAWKVSLVNYSGTRPIGYTFDFYTGTGLRKNGESVFSVADFIRSMIMEADFSELSFKEWSDQLGYNSDSIKALRLYEECRDVAYTFRYVLGWVAIEKLRELLEDY